jgi:hypothetical protein
MTILKSLLFIFIIFIFTACSNSSSSIDVANNTSLKPDVFIDKNRSNLNREVREFSSKYRGPIINALTHLDPPVSGIINEEKLQKIINIAHDKNIIHLFVSPTPNEEHIVTRKKVPSNTLGKKSRLALKSLDNEFVSIYCGGEYISNWMHEAFYNGYKEDDFQKRLERLENDLQDPNCKAFGEIGVYHFDKLGGQNVIAFDPTFEPFVKVIGKIVESNKWINLHMEPVRPENGDSFEDSVFGGVAYLFKKFPNMKLILSHSAMTSPQNLERLLKKYPNLMVTFKLIPKPNKWKNLEPIVNTQWNLYEDWARLFETMPERFLVGTDDKFGRESKKHKNPLKKFSKNMKMIRKVLGSIESNAAQKIAYENAKRIFELN